MIAVGRPCLQSSTRQLLSSEEQERTRCRIDTRSSATTVALNLLRRRVPVQRQLQARESLLRFAPAGRVETESVPDRRWVESPPAPPGASRRRWPRAVTMRDLIRDRELEAAVAIDVGRRVVLVLVGHRLAGDLQGDGRDRAIAVRRESDRAAELGARLQRDVQSVGRRADRGQRQLAQLGAAEGEVVLPAGDEPVDREAVVVSFSLADLVVASGGHGADADVAVDAVRCAHLAADRRSGGEPDVDVALGAGAQRGRPARRRPAGPRMRPGCSAPTVGGCRTGRRR